MSTFWHAVLEGIIVSGIIGIVGGLVALVGRFAFKGAVDTGLEKINKIVTENSNRVRSEMIEHSDAQHAENKSALKSHSTAFDVHVAEDKRFFAENKKDHEVFALQLSEIRARLKP